MLNKIKWYLIKYSSHSWKRWYYDIEFSLKYIKNTVNIKQFVIRHAMVRSYTSEIRTKPHHSLHTQKFAIKDAKSIA